MAEFLKLKKSNCRNCYKCIRNCPVKSIRFSGNQAHIVHEECILCGQCFVVCPQNAKEIADSTEKVKVMLMGDAPVIASVAPSFIANYHGVTIAGLESALRKLGFAAAEETARGATVVKNEYDRILAEEQPNILISSCCHSVNLLIQKHFPNELQYLADVLSPMQAHCIDIKQRYPNAKTVFIGPCVAKKDEADYYTGITDAALTFEELSAWLKSENITIRQGSDTVRESRTRLFPTTGGILKTMTCNEKYSYIAIDGIENCIAALHDIERGQLSHCFIEMSACVGSCIGGLVMEKHSRSPIRDYTQITACAGDLDFVVDPLPNEKIRKEFRTIHTENRLPNEYQIIGILKQMGKTRPEQELNCGSCGYNTCREKAIAVYNGKADLSMCLPFLKEKAESFSGNIFHNTPNAIVVLNEELEVQQINKAALQLLNIESSSHVMGEPVVRILNPDVFTRVKNSGMNIYDNRTYLAEYNKYIDQTVVYDGDYHILICIMRDVTSEENDRKRKAEISRHTVEITDKVVDKQLRVVQEIASLLGETAAETKVALSKLKGSISNE